MKTSATGRGARPTFLANSGKAGLPSSWTRSAQARKNTSTPQPIYYLPLLFSFRCIVPHSHHSPRQKRRSAFPEAPRDRWAENLFRATHPRTLSYYTYPLILPNCRSADRTTFPTFAILSARKSESIKLWLYFSEDFENTILPRVCW